MISDARAGSRPLGSQPQDLHNSDAPKNSAKFFRLHSRHQDIGCHPCHPELQKTPISNVKNYSIQPMIVATIQHAEEF
jgi:hypothetical protein